MSLKSRASELLKVPSWAKESFADADSIKVFARCVIAAWAAFILILPSKSLAVLGNAGFFAALSLMMITPNLPVQMYFLGALTLLLGMLFGWAWSCAAMASAISVRSETLLAAAYQREASSIAGQSNPDQLFQRDLFHVEAIRPDAITVDPASSAVFGAFLFIGTFFCAYVKTVAPKLALFSVFATVIIDVYTSYGPLFPSAQYLFLQTFIISAACGVAIGLASSVLIFPQTANYTWLKGYVALFETFDKLLDAEKESIASSARGQSAKEDSTQETQSMDEISASLAEAMQGVEDMNGMLELEVSYGKFPAEDLKSLVEPTKRVLVQLSCLRVVCESLASDSNTQPSKEHGPSETWLAAYHNQRETSENGPTRKHLLPILSDLADGIFGDGRDVLSSVKELCDSINRSRWSMKAGSQNNKTSPLTTLEEALATLRRTRTAFSKDERLRLLEPYREIFGGHDGHVKLDQRKLPPFPVKTLFMSLAFCDNILFVADSIIDLGAKIADLGSKRQKSRFWFPTGLRHVGQYLQSGKEQSSEKAIEVEEADSSDRTEMEDEKSKNEKSFTPGLDPQARLGYEDRKGARKIALRLYEIYAWGKTPEALFCLKYAVISILFWLPSVFRTTAFFNYTNKVLWAQIMAQTGLGIYASDQLAAYIPRLIGTLAGLVLGMLAWYIGNGNGNGSPYGTAAVVFVFLMPLVMLRLHAKDLILAIMTSVTVLLIIGYSWIDTHLQTISNPGKGYQIAWKRWLLVIVGMTGAFIFMLIPPASGQRHVRNEHAAIIKSLLSLYSDLVEGWHRPRERQQKTGDTQRGKARRDDILAIFNRLSAIQMQDATLKFEIDLKGRWPAKEYQDLLKIERSLLHHLAFLAVSLSHANKAVQESALRHIAIFNKDTVADIQSTLYIMHSCLQNASAVPAAVPKSLMDRALHHRENRTSSTPDKNVDVLQSDKLTFEQLASDHLMSNATTVVASYQLLSDIDRLQEVVRKLCGQQSMPALERWAAGSV